MSQHFLKPYKGSGPGEVDWASLPLKQRDQKALAVWLCRQNGPVPSDFLQVGLAILRRLDLDQLPDGEGPPFWAFVGLLEWVQCASPEMATARSVTEELRQLYLLSRFGLDGVYERVEAKHPDLKLTIMKMKL